jgi:zinc protease
MSMVLTNKPFAFRRVANIGLTALCLWLALAPAASAQTTAASKDAVQTPAARAADIQRAIAIQAQLVTEFEVNGLKVLVKHRAGSATAAAALYFRGGTRNTTAENAGIEGLTLDVSTEASLNYPRERMRTELASMASQVGGSAGLDYSALVMASTAQNFARTWNIFTDVALNPKFAPDDLARIRDRRLAGLRDAQSDPDGYLDELQSRAAYVGHPYVNDPEGTEATIGKFTVADLAKYHTQMMQTSRLLLVVVGDVDAEALKKKIAASFGKLPKGNYEPSLPPGLAFTTPSVDVTTRSLPTNYIQGVFAAPPLTSPDIYPMRVALSILHERIFQEVRVKRNLSYAPSAFLRTQGANIGGIYVSAVDANRAVGVMLDEINTLQTVPIEEDEISGVAGQYLTTYYVGQETNVAQAAELAQYELIGGGWKNSLYTLEKLRQVTPADVQRVARKYIRNLQFVVIGDPNAINKQIFTRQSAG